MTSTIIINDSEITGKGLIAAAEPSAGGAGGAAIGSPLSEGARGLLEDSAREVAVPRKQRLTEEPCHSKKVPLGDDPSHLVTIGNHL